MYNLGKKLETIKGLEMALKNGSWGIESMAFEVSGRGEFIKFDFVNECYQPYYINITGSSPQGIVLDVIRFIEEKKYKG